MRLFHKRVITNEAGKPYLIRYTIISTRWFRVFIHKILRSDDDRDCHNHPWSFVTVILKGGYTEHRPGGWSRYFGSGSIIRHKAMDAHRLELERPVWSLFMAGPRVREWGFLTDKGEIPWRQYIDSRNHPH